MRERDYCCGGVATHTVQTTIAKYLAENRAERWEWAEVWLSGGRRTVASAWIDMHNTWESDSCLASLDAAVRFKLADAARLLAMDGGFLSKTIIKYCDDAVTMMLEARKDCEGEGRK